MSKQTSLADLFKKFEHKDINANKDVFGKGVSIAIDTFAKVALKGYLIEYLNKDGDVVIHVFSKKWRDDFIDILKKTIENMGDVCECDFVPEMDSWYVRIKNFSVRRFGAEADAAYISSLLVNL